MIRYYAQYHCDGAIPWILQKVNSSTLKPSGFCNVWVENKAMERESDLPALLIIKIYDFL